MDRNSKVKIIEDKDLSDEVKEQVSDEYLEMSRELDDIENRRIKFKCFDNIGKLMEDLKK